MAPRLPQGARGMRSSPALRYKEVKFVPHLAEQNIENPFPGLKTLEKAIGKQITTRIGSNESIAMKDHPLSSILSPDVLDLVRLYPDPYCRDIRAFLAEKFRMNEEEIITDAGGDSLIFLALRTRISPGDLLVTTAGTYPTVRYLAQGLGAKILEVPYAQEKDALKPSLQDLAKAAIDKQADVVYIANPDNPTGQAFTSGEIMRFRSWLPEDTTLILDEAYIDFCPNYAVMDRLPNTIQIRTMSKAYGLAGIRLGYAFARAPWVEKADQIRVQFTTNSLTNFLAMKVLQDANFSTSLIQETIQLRTQLTDKLRSNGLKALSSNTNFVPVVYPSKADAIARQKALWDIGVAVHRPPHPSMQHVLRITASPQALDEAIISRLV